MIKNLKLTDLPVHCLQKFKRKCDGKKGEILNKSDLKSYKSEQLVRDYSL